MAYPSIIPDNVGTKKKKTGPYGNPISSAGTNPTTSGNGTVTPSTYGQVPIMHENATGTDQMVPLSSDAIKLGENDQVLSTAQGAAVNQPGPANNYLNNLVQEQTGNLLRDPNQGLDTASYKRNVMDEFNSQLSETSEGARRRLGDTSQSGELQNEFLKNALLGARQRADLSTQTDFELSNLKKQNLIDALAEGRAGVESSGKVYSDYINNLATVRDMAEGERSQTAEMSHEEEMAQLDYELEDAMANNDVVREKEILDKQSDLTLIEMEKEHGYDTVLETLRGNIESAIQQRDINAQAAIQVKELKYRVEHDIKAFAIEEARMKLEEKGVDMDIVERQYNQVADVYGEEAANEFMATTLKEHGVDTSSFKIADKIEGAKKALQDEYDLMTKQFLQTHPEYKTQLFYVDGQLVDTEGMSLIDLQLIQKNAAYGVDGFKMEEGLTLEGQNAYHDVYNFTMYGEMTEEMEEKKRTAGYLTDSDISFATPGDKFNITTTIPSGDGRSIPPGEYNVTSDTSSEGSKFFGQQRDVTKLYLENKDGKYLIKQFKSGTKGNFVSGLWADN